MSGADGGEAFRGPEAGDLGYSRLVGSRDSEVLRRADEFGVDLSLLRERLELTPTERLERHARALELVEAMRAAGERKRRGETERADRRPRR